MINCLLAHLERMKLLLISLWCRESVLFFLLFPHKEKDKRMDSTKGDELVPIHLNGLVVKL